MENEIKRTINEVLNCETGDEIIAGKFFKHSIDKIHEYRSELQKAIDGIREPIFVCYYCKQKIRIRGGVAPTGKSKMETMHFAHLKDSEECHIKTQNKFSREEVDRMKYNGVKESALHIDLKNKIAECLILNETTKGEITNIQIEKVIKGPIDKDWRKPDINSLFLGKRIAFELQLSTTWLGVITQRQQFYKQNGMYIFWIFNKFSVNDYIRDLTSNDVIYTNNQNAYVFDEETYALSKKENDLIIKCYYKVYSVSQNKVYEDWKSEFIRLSDLTFDPINFKVFYYDSNKQRDLANADIAESLKKEEEAKELEETLARCREAEKEEKETAIEINNYYLERLKNERAEIVRNINSQTYRFKSGKSNYHDLIKYSKDITLFLSNIYYLDPDNIITKDVIEELKKQQEEIKVEDEKINKIKASQKTINSLRVLNIDDINYSIIPQTSWDFIEKNYKLIKVMRQTDEADLFSNTGANPISSELELSRLKYTKDNVFLVDYSHTLKSLSVDILNVQKIIAGMESHLSDKLKQITYSMKAYYIKKLKKIRDEKSEIEMELDEIESDIKEKIDEINYFRESLDLVLIPYT